MIICYSSNIWNIKAIPNDAEQLPHPIYKVEYFLYNQGQFLIAIS